MEDKGRQIKKTLKDLKDRCYFEMCDVQSHISAKHFSLLTLGVYCFTLSPGQEFLLSLALEGAFGQ